MKYKYVLFEDLYAHINGIEGIMLLLIVGFNENLKSSAFIRDRRKSYKPRPRLGTRDGFRRTNDLLLPVIFAVVSVM